MLIAASTLKGYAVFAKDGALGVVRDALFDHRSWRLRWFVVDTGAWISERKILVHPLAVTRADHAARGLSVDLTKEQVEKSPDIGEHEPVSSQLESRLYDYYRWNAHWGDDGLFSGAMALPFPGPALFGATNGTDATIRPQNAKAADARLRGVGEVTGYHVHANDGALGHVENFFVDDAQWDERYLVVATRDWLPGRRVLLSPGSIVSIGWAEREVRVNLTRAAVKASPEWDPLALIDGGYEKRLHRHYGWPGYGF